MTETMLTVLRPDAEIEEVEKMAGRAVGLAHGLEVVDQPTFEMAAVMLRDVKGRLIELDKKRKAITGPMDKSKKEVMDLFRPPTDKLKEVEATIKGAMVTYEHETEAAARKAQAAIEEKARREREALEKRAANHEAKGRDEKADDLRAQADATHVPQVSNKPDAVEGISTRTTWSAEVVDPDALARAVMDGKAPRAVLKIDMKVLNNLATALKEDFDIPGCKAVPEKHIAVRS